MYHEETGKGTNLVCFLFLSSWCCLPHQSLRVNGLTVGGIALKANA